MESDKELMKRDIIMVTKISLKIDYLNRTQVKEIYDKLKERKILKTSIGSKYLKRLEMIVHGEEPEHNCVICWQETGDNPIICKNCLGKIQIVRSEPSSKKEVVSQDNTEKNLKHNVNKSSEKSVDVLSEHLKNADTAVNDTAKLVSEKTKKVIEKVSEKAKANNPISKKKKKWMWIIGVLLGCYFISKAFGLDSSISDEDTLSLIGQNINDTNKLYGEGKWYDAINAVTYSNGLAVNYDSEDTLKIIYVSIETPYNGTLCNLSIGDTVDMVTEEMNNMEAQVVEEEAAAGYSVEERGYRNYSFKYDGKTMMCCVSFQGGVVTGVASYEKNSKVD